MISLLVVVLFVAMFIAAAFALALPYPQSDWAGAVAIVAIVLLVVAIICDYGHRAAYGQPTTADITAAYSMPSELAGCRVYRLRAAGLGRTLYVVSRDGRPEATSWRTDEGKNNTQYHTAVTP